MEFRTEIALVVAGGATGTQVPLTVDFTLASSCAFSAAIAVAALGSGGGIGLPSLVCNLTT